MGLDQHKRFHRYHRVLSRARWSNLQASRVLLGLLRKELWAQEEQTFHGSPWEADTIRVPRAFVQRLAEAVCYAA